MYGGVALAIHQAIYEALETLAQRLKEYGDEARCQQRDEQVATCLQDLTKQDDDHYVDANDTGGEHAIDQRAVDDNVDIPQVGAQDSDAK